MRARGRRPALGAPHRGGARATGFHVAHPRPPGAPRLRARDLRAARGEAARPPLAEAGPLPVAGARRHGRLPLLLAGGQGGARGRGGAHPRRRHRAGPLPLHVPRRDGPPPGDPPRLPAPGRRARCCCARDPRARSRRWSRPSPATPAWPTPGPTPTPSRRWPGCPPRPSWRPRRGLGLELERIGMHLAGLSGLANDIAFLQGAATYGRLRTTVINTIMLVCGSRFGRGWVRPGGAPRAARRRGWPRPSGPPWRCWSATSGSSTTGCSARRACATGSRGSGR